VAFFEKGGGVYVRVCVCECVCVCVCVRERERDDFCSKKIEEELKQLSLTSHKQVKKQNNKYNESQKHTFVLKPTSRTTEPNKIEHARFILSS
jgi:hypothetical protein